MLDVTEKKRSVSNGCWDSIHVVEARDLGDGRAKYKLTTTVMLSMVVPGSEAGKVDMSGSLTRQASKDCKLDDAVNTHIVNMGKMIEEMEISLRKALDDLYIQRTRHIVNSIRKPTDGAASAGPTRNFLAELGSAVGAQAAKTAAFNAKKKK